MFALLFNFITYNVVHIQLSINFLAKVLSQFVR